MGIKQRTPKKLKLAQVKEEKVRIDEAALKALQSRREFLWKAGLLLGAAAFGLGGVLVRNILRPNYGGWNFLDPEKLGLLDFNEAQLTDMTSNGIRIGIEQIIDPKTIEGKRLIDRLGSKAFGKAKEMGYDDSVEWEVSLTQNIIGIPLEDSLAQPFLCYVKKAVSFLYSEVKGLDPFPENYVVVKPGDDWSFGFKYKTFLVKEHCLLGVFDAVNPTRSGQRVSFANALMNSGGAALFDRSTVSNNSWWYLILSAGDTAISSPFSEILPVLIVPRTSEYYAKTDPEEAAQALEAITEGMSNLLSHKLVKELNIPNGAERIEASYRQLSRGSFCVRYQYVRNAIEWLRLNGLQKGLDLYMEDPAKFMVAIKK